MKKLLIGMLISFCLVAIQSRSVQAQEDAPTRKQERLDRKKAKALEFEQEKAEVARLAQERDLVLEANTLSGKFGFHATPVGANNYVLIDSADFILQTSSPAYVGQNGIGGVTIRGTIESYEVTTSGQHVIVVIAQVNTYGLGPATITLNLMGKQNCRATFSTASGIVLNLAGPGTSVSESKVYEGTRL